MPLFATEGTHSGEFIVSEANGSRSRESAVVTSGQNLVAGAVVATIAGKLVEFDDDASDGSETATGILLDAVDASSADADGVVIVRDAEVNVSEIVWESTQDATDILNGTADLLALGIVAR